jgi:hypothetical protein
VARNRYGGKAARGGKADAAMKGGQYNKESSREEQNVTVLPDHTKRYRDVMACAEGIASASVRPGAAKVALVTLRNVFAALCKVHPPETDPGFETGVDFEPGEDDSLYDPVAFPETIQRLLRQRKPLKECFDDAEVVLAVYDYPFMLERIRRNWGTEIDAEGIELVCESDFKAFLHKHFVEECGKP